MKDIILKLLKESTEEEREKDHADNYKEMFGRDYKKDYADVKNYFDDESTAKATRASVFREVGFSEEDLYTGLPYKMLNQEENPEGGIYNFDAKTLDKIRTALPRG